MWSIESVTTVLMKCNVTYIIMYHNNVQMNAPATLRMVIKSAPVAMLTGVDLRLDHTYGLGLCSSSSHPSFSDYCFRPPHMIKQIVKNIPHDSHVSWLYGVTPIA